MCALPTLTDCDFRYVAADYDRRQFNISQAVWPTNSSTMLVTMDGSSNNNSDSKPTLSSGATAGIAIGITALLIILGLLGYRLIRKRKIAADKKRYAAISRPRPTGPSLDMAAMKGPGSPSSVRPDGMESASLLPPSGGQRLPDFRNPFLSKADFDSRTSARGLQTPTYELHTPNSAHFKYPTPYRLEPLELDGREGKHGGEGRNREMEPDAAVELPANEISR